MKPVPIHRRTSAMCETAAALKLGQKIPDFEVETYDPLRDDFGSFRLRDQISKKRWTILFFYPADFTFV
jgi:alkyl hydroperoxide reductase subunit AhpC